MVGTTIEVPEAQPDVMAKVLEAVTRALPELTPDQIVELLQV